MVDRDLLAARLAELTGRVARVRARRTADAASLAADRDAMELVAFNLMLAVQAGLDVATHVIADRGLGAGDRPGRSNLIPNGRSGSTARKWVPVALEDQHRTLLAEAPLDAVSLRVPTSFWQRHQLRRRNLLRRETVAGVVRRGARAVRRRAGPRPQGTGSATMSRVPSHRTWCHGCCDRP